MSIRKILSRALLAGIVLTAAACNKDDDGGGDAQIRLLNLSEGYPTLDLMTNIDTDDDDEDATQASSVALESVSTYATLDPDDYTIKVKRTGSGSVLRSFAGEELVEDTINTYVAYGEVGAFGALRLDDTQDPADTGDIKLSVANLSSAGLVDVYLTDTSVDLDDTTPVLSQVGAGFAGLTTDAGTFRLRVTATGDNDDIRLDIPSITLDSRGVASLIFTSTRGGMLVNAILMPQGGSPTRLANSKARLRGAVAVANGASASIRANGVSILSAAQAGVIGSRYTVLDAGSVPITLTVNGAPVTVPNVTLQAGADYTLLVYTAAAGPTAALITDDNRLPSNSSVAKLRLLNGMSTLGAPLTLSVDFSPIIEGTLLGEVSDEYEITAGTDRQIDITNTSNAAAVLSRSGVALATNSVYTFFMTDSGATAVGVLRRDR